MGNVLISSASVPADFCGITQAQWTVLVGLLTGQFNRTGTGINFGNDVPTAENEDKPWFRLNPDGTPDRIYYHVNGLWVAAHPIPTGAVWMYEGTEASIDTFDGGEVAAIGDFTGPMWEKVSQMDARSPIGPGTLPSGTVIGIGDDLGAETFTLDALNLPSHFHEIIADSTGAKAGGDGGWIIGSGPAASGTPARDMPPSATNPRTGRTENAGEIAADIDPVSNVHPVHAIWHIRKTSRRWYRFI